MGMPQGDLKLLAAVKANNVHLVRELLNRGHNADARGDLTWSCLQEAVMRNHYEIVDVLSARSKRIDNYSFGTLLGDYYTALHFAIIHHNLEIVELLLSHGADVSLRSLVLGKTVLHIAAQYANPAIIELLLKSGADINAIDDSGLTVLHTSVRNENLDVMKFLIGYGCDVDRVDSYGETLLMSCLQNSSVVHAKYLLEANISTRIKRNFRGDTLLHLGVACNSDEIISLILNLGIDIDAVNKDGFTALCLACKSYYDQSVQSLLKYICDTSVIDISIIERLTNDNRIAFKKQAMRLASLNRAEGVRNLLHINNVSTSGFSLINYCTSCVHEMRKMKELRIGDTNVTLLDVIEMDVDQITKLLSNDVIRQFSLMNLVSVSSELPVYKDTVNYLFTVAHKRRSLIQQLCNMDSCFSVLSQYCFENILYRLTNNELAVLIESLNPPVIN